MGHLQALVARTENRFPGSALNLGEYAASLKLPPTFASLKAIGSESPEHPLYLKVENALVPGSYFQGRCTVRDSVIIKSDVRGDELKRSAGSAETIRVRDSCLYKSLVHSNSHDPDSPNEFPITESVAMHYSNIHGSPLRGCLLKPFATVDLTSASQSSIGTFSYVQTGKLADCTVEDGNIWIRGGDKFDFKYSFDKDALETYVRFESGAEPEGILIDLLVSMEKHFDRLFNECRLPPDVPQSSYLSPYAVVQGNSRIGENAFVAQRAFLKNANIGDGSNAQENCCIIDSALHGNDVSAHGSKMICATLQPNVFVGFNSFLRGTPHYRLRVGSRCIVAPHTIIDLVEPLEIPSDHLVWGLIRSRSDLESHSISLQELSQVKGELSQGMMFFRGRGKAFVDTFRHRIEHILETNGAFCSGDEMRGHAQKCDGIRFKAIDPELDCELEGI